MNPDILIRVETREGRGPFASTNLPLDAAELSLLMLPRQCSFYFELTTKKGHYKFGFRDKIKWFSKSDISVLASLDFGIGVYHVVDAVPLPGFQFAFAYGVQVNWIPLSCEKAGRFLAW